jgi:hypothetical protein
MAGIGEPSPSRAIEHLAVLRVVGNRHQNSFTANPDTKGFEPGGSSSEMPEAARQAPAGKASGQSQRAMNRAAEESCWYWRSLGLICRPRSRDISPEGVDGANLLRRVGATRRRASASRGGLWRQTAAIGRPSLKRSTKVCSGRANLVAANATASGRVAHRRRSHPRIAVGVVGTTPRRPSAGGGASPWIRRAAVGGRKAVPGSTRPPSVLPGSPTIGGHLLGGWRFVSVPVGARTGPPSSANTHRFPAFGSFVIEGHVPADAARRDAQDTASIELVVIGCR